MAPEYKGDAYYRKYVGRYFKRNTGSNCSAIVYKVIEFREKDRLFITECYELFLGGGVYRDNCELMYSFVDAPNFAEISEREFDGVAFLLDHSGIYGKNHISIRINPEIVDRIKNRN